DPLPTLDIAGRGASDLLGTLTAHVAYQRDTDALTATMEAPGASFGTAQVQRIAAYSPELAAHLRQLTANLRVQATVRRDPKGPWSHTIRCQLSGGKLRHPQVPLPLENVEARLRCDDGRLSIDSLTASSGPTRVSLNALADTPAADTNLSGTLTVS